MELDFIPSGQEILDRIIGASLFAGRVATRFADFLPPNKPNYMSDHFAGNQVTSQHDLIDVQRTT